MPRERIRFIINPKSGTASKKNIASLVDRFLDKDRYEADIAYTQTAGHATVLAREAAELSYAVVVAVGGDGSVNETAAGLLGSGTALGIIPTGSGNGMARHLKISMDSSAAVQLLNTCSQTTIDTLEVNGRICVGTIGIGFDAHVAHLFANSAVRGYATYVKLVLQEFYKYSPLQFEMIVDGQNVSAKCFLLTFANSSQFGNNAIIAPFANVQDGIMDVSMLCPFASYRAPHLIYRLMKNTLHKSRYFKMLTARDIRVHNNGSLKGHIDGEPVTFEGDLYVKIRPASLKVAVPDAF